jgi:predicted RNA-binding Zn ribbon-like protein
MSFDEIPSSWSKRFGLAVSPLFENDEISDPGCHSVFLDGGQGTFALSLSEEETWRDHRGAAWAWSSDIAHHVTVTPNNVAVVRWDNPSDVSLLSRASVEKNLDAFYRLISADRVRSTRTVVYHLLGLFRRIRSLTASASVPDARSSEIYLLCLARLISDESGSTIASRWGIADDVEQLSATLDQNALSTALNEIKRSISSIDVLRLHPSLAIRHAGGL